MPNTNSLNLQNFPNSRQIVSHTQNKVQFDHNKPRFGLIVDVRREHHERNAYTVRCPDNGQVFKEVKVLNQQASFNGTGTINPLKEGEPVLLIFLDDAGSEPFIVGSFYTLGDPFEYLDKGKLQEIDQTLETLGDGNKTYNQPPGLPLRITQPGAYYQAIGGENMKREFHSPNEKSTIDEKNQEREFPSSITFKNEKGDILHYSTSSIINYSDKEIIEITRGEALEEVDSLTRLCKYYSDRATFIEDRLKKVVTIINGFTGEVLPYSKQETYTTHTISAPPSYISESYRELCKLALEKSKQENSLQASLEEQARSLTSKYGSELKPISENFPFFPALSEAQLKTGQFNTRALLIREEATEEILNTLKNLPRPTSITGSTPLPRELNLAYIKTDSPMTIFNPVGRDNTLGTTTPIADLRPTGTKTPPVDLLSRLGFTNEEINQLLEAGVLTASNANPSIATKFNRLFQEKKTEEVKRLILEERKRRGLRSIGDSSLNPVFRGFSR